MNLHYESVHPHSDSRLHTEIKRLGQTVFQAWKTVNQKSFIAGILIMAIYTLGGSPVYAAGSGDVCMVDRYNAVNKTSLTDLNCVANDVSLAIYEVVEGPPTCLEGETIEVSLKGDFMVTASERQDVGVFISEDGGDPNTTGGVCYSDFLHPVSADNTDLELTLGLGPFYNDEISTTFGRCDGAAIETECSDNADCAGIGTNTCVIVDDACGDIRSIDGPTTFITGTSEKIKIICQDSDGDFLADVASCTVWANSASDGSINKPICTDESDVTAETSAKCTCANVNIIGIDFLEQGAIEVVKDLVPNDDAGLFNLEIDSLNYCEDGLTQCTDDTACIGIGTGTCVAIDVGDAGTTTPKIVGAGTHHFPGTTYDVGETAGTSTSLGSYTTAISCVDRGLGTFGGTCSGGDAGICDGGGTSELGMTCDNGDAADACILAGGLCVSGFACDPTGTADTDACVAGRNM